MGPWVAVLALWPVLRAAAGPPPALPSITDKAFIEDCTRVHNDLRTKVQPPASNMRYMTWDAALARTARAWANKCIFKHNVCLSKKHQCHPNFTSVGENIWVGSHQIFYVADAIKSWYNEVKFYIFAVHKCTKVCGHYLQVVSAYSYKVGCAVTLCKEVAGIRNAANFVCNYSPSSKPIFDSWGQKIPIQFYYCLNCMSEQLQYASADAAGIKLRPTSGNFPRRPYMEGKPCGNCTKEDTCENKLCRNPERDKIISYSRWHPPWEYSIVCDEACITVVVLRPSLMFLAFVAVYFIKKHFTNMHMST